jgi:hypothetical protein
MGYVLVPQQFTLSANASIGITISVNNGDWVGVAVIYGVPIGNGTVSARTGQLNWAGFGATYSSSITNFNPFPTTIFAHMGWINL